MHLLVHVCCGPCASYPVPYLLKKGHKLHGFFYNPNIHPYQEYSRRMEAAKQMAAAFNIEMIWASEYELEKYLREVSFREDKRCRYCYYLRLQRAAQVAKHGHFDAFTTSLLVSPYQKHDLIREIGELAAKEVGVPFYYEDFRPGYAESVARSRELGLYRQPYCGCIFSERDRYAPRNKKAKENTSGNK